jgi:hypothetical protein
MATRLEIIKSRIDLYLAAEKKILESDQAWTSPEGMNYTRANLDVLRREIRMMMNELEFLEGKSSYLAQRPLFGGR